MAADVTFVPDPAGWQYAFRSWDGVVGRHMIRRTELLRTLARLSAPAPTHIPRNRTRTNYSTGKLFSEILASHGRWGPELEGRVVALPREALFVHEGTRPHVIRARKPGGVLRWRDRRSGRLRFAPRVMHPGTKAVPFLTEHLRRVVKM